MVRTLQPITLAGDGLPSSVGLIGNVVIGNGIAGCVNIAPG
ncbi:hypothetical protein [Microcella alkaliphila]|nr:hypothetical protein [Microcella alkaliphila]